MSISISFYKMWTIIPVTTYLEHCNLTLFALRKVKIIYNFGLSECSRVNVRETSPIRKMSIKLLANGHTKPRCNVDDDYFQN